MEEVLPGRRVLGEHGGGEEAVIADRETQVHLLANGNFLLTIPGRLPIYVSPGDAFLKFSNWKFVDEVVADLRRVANMLEEVAGMAHR